MIRAGSSVILLLAASAAAAQPEPQAQPHAPAATPQATPQPVPQPAPDPTSRIALFATHTSGVDPAVARFVDRALLRAATALGHTPVDAEQARSAQQAFAPDAPLGLADLWTLTHRLDAEIGVSALASANAGRYTLELRVASRDGRGPFYARGEASHLELEAAVERLLTQALTERAAALVPAASAPQPPASEAAAPTPPRVADDPASAATLEAHADEPQPPQLRLAVHNDVAFGLAEDSFVNEVLGARADLRLDDALWLGVHVGYANLPGREGRVHGALPYVQLEQRIALGAGRALAIPLRLGLGYLLRNGGFLRLSSGLAIPLGARSELVLDLLAPAFWTTRDKTLFSLVAGAELAFEL